MKFSILTVEKNIAWTSFRNENTKDNSKTTKPTMIDAGHM